MACKPPQHLNWDQMQILLQLRIENYKWEFLSDLDGVGHGDRHEDDVGAIDIKASNGDHVDDDDDKNWLAWIDR